MGFFQKPRRVLRLLKLLFEFLKIIEDGAELLAAPDAEHLVDEFGLRFRVVLVQLLHQFYQALQVILEVPRLVEHREVKFLRCLLGPARFRDVHFLPHLALVGSGA